MIFTLETLDSFDSVDQVIVTCYVGSGAEATELFAKDVMEKRRQGYRPTSQSWAPGSYSHEAAVLALLLCLIGIGVFFVVYMLIVKPPGMLTVTYEFVSARVAADGDS